MKRESTSILDYLKAIAWVVVPFCLLGSLHYLFVFFPRTVYEKDNHILFNHLGFDYFGIVVGFFTLLITFLVGWQIFSTIKAKEELREMQREYKVKFEEQMKKLESKIDNISHQQNVTNDEVKEMTGMNKVYERFSEEFGKINNEIAIRYTNLYKWLWSILDENKTVTDILNEFAEMKKTKPSKVSYLDGEEATEKEVITLYEKVRPIKLAAIQANKDFPTP